MKTNLKEQTKQENKKTKVIMSLPTSKENNTKGNEEELCQNLQEVWKEEIVNFKNMNFSTISEMREYIVDRVLEKQNAGKDKEQRDFLISILKDNLMVEDILKKYLKQQNK